MCMAGDSICLSLTGFLELLDDVRKKCIIKKLRVSSLEEAARRIKALAGKRIFVHFKEGVSIIEGVNYLHVFPELNTASAEVSAEDLVRILLNENVEYVEEVPEATLS